MSKTFSIMKNVSDPHFYVILHALFVCSIGLALGFRCKDENNNDVDWFIVYKLPGIKQAELYSNLRNGEAYAYITPGASKWTLSSISIGSTDSMLGRTLQGVTDNMKNDEVSYLFYNDSPQKKSTVAAGHAKGIVAFKGEIGFWLVHSIPNYSSKDKYEFPRSALVNGQIAMCVTFGSEALNNICTHLLYCHPNIYARQLSESLSYMLDDKAHTLFEQKPAFIRKEPFLYKAEVKSFGNQMFSLFAKDNQLDEDLYSDIIAPFLKTPLVVETWRRGSGGKLDPSCNSDHYVVDITSIGMKVSNTEEDIRFNSTLDHSKWAVSQKEADNWVCISDLNRMASQAKRGGGAICFKSKEAWSAFNSVIHETVTCPRH